MTLAAECVMLFLDDRADHFVARRPSDASRSTLGYFASFVNKHSCDGDLIALTLRQEELPATEKTPRLTFA